MEFPDLGNHCWERTCHKLDFLPVKCDACDKIFCSDHFGYTKHICLSSYHKYSQNPVCPLCGVPIPTVPGSSPDQTFNEHIDQYCKSKIKKVFINWCLVENCKKKELIRFQCSVCKLNFFLKHPFTTDHDCKGPKETRISFAAEPETVQGNTIEEQALARVVALSIIEVDESGYRNRRKQEKQTLMVKGTCCFIGFIILISIFFYHKFKF